ncbi:MAG: dUTP diphosphatase [Pseudomonadota bacterium]
MHDNDNFSNTQITLNIKTLPHFDGLKIPDYQTAGSAGIDLAAAIDKDVVITKGQWLLIPTGISIALPQGYEAQIRPRSGLAFKHGITVLNSPGTIDSDYRGEVKILLINLGDDDFIFTRGDRIAQMVITKYTIANVNLVSSLDETERHAAGFGSTGVK